MDTKLTVSVKGLLLAGLVLLALVVAYLLGAGGRGAPPPASAAGGERAQDERGLTMVGKGVATAVPDELSFGLSVTQKNSDLETALTGTSTTLTKVLTALEGHGVEKADVQTTGLEMHPEYSYPNGAPPVLTGYRVTQRVRIQIDELGQGGKAISTAVTTGGNGVRVGNVRLEVGDPDAVIEQARTAAVEEARAKAEQYADATGQELGAVVRIREISAPQPAPVRVELAGGLDDLARDAAKAVPISAGESDLTVRVEVVWSLG